ncbi:MAG TPA: hypothetical protein VGQ24_17015, partial [Gemmatimonadales bacterium]|nr:hypothetical protein [Gemmatimonadales bacterium]
CGRQALMERAALPAPETLVSNPAVLVRRVGRGSPDALSRVPASAGAREPPPGAGIHLDWRSDP